MTETITAERVLTLLDQAVEDRGAKYRYPTNKVTWRHAFYGAPFTEEQVHDGDVDTEDEGQQQDLDEGSACHYFATERDAALTKTEVGAPMCIVGWVFDALGYSASDLSRWDNIQSDAASAVSKLAAAHPDSPASFEPEALSILLDAQANQDNGATWGGAVEVARRNHRSRTDEL